MLCFLHVCSLFRRTYAFNFGSRRLEKDGNTHVHYGQRAVYSYVSSAVVELQQYHGSEVCGHVALCLSCPTVHHQRCSYDSSFYWYFQCTSTENKKKGPRKRARQPGKDRRTPRGSFYFHCLKIKLTSIAKLQGLLRFALTYVMLTLAWRFQWNDTSTMLFWQFLNVNVTQRWIAKCQRNEPFGKFHRCQRQWNPKIIFLHWSVNVRSNVDYAETT